MKNYRNDQINSAIDEVSDICVKVAKNVKGIRLTVSAISSEVMTVETDLTHVLDVGEEFSFFYTNEEDAIADQATLTTHLRFRGVVVSKVHKQQPLTLNQ
jgi:hypothetical protein